MIIKYSISILLLFGVLACSQAPKLDLYTLDTSTNTKVHKTVYKTKSIKVVYPQSLREAISEKMNFSYSNSEQGSYQNSQWSNHLAKLLQANFIETLEESHLFKAVLSDSSTAQENYRLESNIFAFHHRVRGEASHAIVSIQFNLINAQTGQLVKSKRLSYQESTTSLDAKGYAQATNRILQRLSQDLLLWL
ncbi:MAG: hypothetical protein DRQ78_12625 [Epsilonproteobacteria bacterium]|nr:MAG: hypothetical protein DRQ78_12625 [Campylobacterota bacterium]